MPNLSAIKIGVMKEQMGIASENVSKRIIDKKWQDNCLRSIEALTRKHKNIHQFFFAVTKKLYKIFSISAAILVLHSNRDHSLRVIDIKKAGYSGEALSLILPDKDSLLYSVYRDETIFSESDPDKFNGNFLERKLLLDQTTKSLVICPINDDGRISGLLCLASSLPSAFNSEGAVFLETISRQFRSILSRPNGSYTP